MIPSSWKDQDSTSLEGASERRAAARRAEEERVAQRQRYIDAQTSPRFDAQRRIRLWEQLHGLHLPTTPNHRLVRVIATQTALTVDQIHDEQQRRAAPPVEPESTQAAT